MNCEEAQNALVFYLDGELASEDQIAVQRHLAGCSRCQTELAALQAAQLSARRALQSQAERAEPSPQAWSLLQARLAGEARLSPSKLSAWLSRLAPGSRRARAAQPIGGINMRSKILIPAFAAVIVLVLFAFFATRNVTPVSAQQVIDRAAAVQSAAPTQGIQHIRIESYYNVKALPGDEPGVKTVMDSYRDLASGNFRTVTTDPSGKVLDVFAYDGANTYSVREHDVTPVTVYRVPQTKDLVAVNLGPSQVEDPRQIFEKFRKEPKIEVQAKATWTDGRPVIVLLTQGPVKVMAGDSVQTPTGATSVIFDAQTYQMLEFRMTLQKDGQDIVISSQKYLANEVLPAGTHLAWDLSDLQGISIVPDPKGEHGDVLPETISQQTLNAEVKNPYVLGKIPEGFKQEITAAPNRPKDQPLAYVIAYRNSSGDYIVIQSDDAVADASQIKNAQETYTTSSGLTLYFQREEKVDGKTYSSAVVKTPDGTTFSLTATFSTAELKGIAEGLIQSKG